MKGPKGRVAGLLKSSSLSGVGRVLWCALSVVRVPERTFCLRVGRLRNHFLLPLLWWTYGFTGDSALGGLLLLLSLYLHFRGCSCDNRGRTGSCHTLGCAPTLQSLYEFPSMGEVTQHRSWCVEGEGWLDSGQTGYSR